MAEPRAEVLARHLYDGVPFTVLRLSTGRYRLVRAGDQTDFEGVSALLGALSEPERAMLPDGVVLAGLADRFDAVVQALQNRPGAARELALDALVELLAIAPAVDPQLRPCVRGPVWLQGAFGAVREQLLEGKLREAALVAREAVQGLADLVLPSDRQVLEGEVGREPCVYDGAYWPEGPADFAAAVQAARDLPALTTFETLGTPQVPAFAFPERGEGWSRIDLGQELSHHGVAFRFVPVPPASSAPEPTDQLNVDVASVLVQAQRTQRMRELASPDFIVASAVESLQESVERLLDRSRPQLRYHAQESAPLRPLGLASERPVGPGAVGVLFLPFQYYTLVVQHRNGIAILDLSGQVRAILPALPWPLAYGDGEHAVFMESPRIRNGVAHGVAVLHVPTGAWLESWPERLPAHFVEDSPEGPFFLDPRASRSWPLELDGERVWSADGGLLAVAAGPSRATAVNVQTRAVHQVASASPVYVLDLESGAIEAEPEGTRSASASPLAIGQYEHWFLRVGLNDGVTVSHEQDVLQGAVGPVDAIGFEHAGRYAAYLCGDRVTVVRMHKEDDGGPEVEHRFALPAFVPVRDPSRQPPAL